MNNERHYFIVGLFVLLSAFGLLFFTLWLTMKDDSKYQTYRIRFAESVSGLTVGSDVKFRGVSVGQVKAIRIDPQDSRLIQADISLLKTTPLKTDTVAGLKLQGITGSVYVELTGGDPSKPDMAQNHEEDVIPEIPAQQSSLNALIDRVPILLDKLSMMMDQINKVVSNDNVRAVSQVLRNSDATVSDLHEVVRGSSQDIKRSSRDASSAMRSLKRAAGHAENLGETMENDPASLLFPAEEKGIPAP